MSLERLVELSAKFEEEYNKKIKCAKNVMTTTLENLTDSNVAKLCDISSTNAGHNAASAADLVAELPARPNGRSSRR